MSYINTEDLISKILANSANNPWILLTEKDTDLYHLVAHTKALAKIINEMPSADVVEVETLKKNIEAYIDEARELRDEHSSELIRAFQQGRMFGHKCDLEMIKKGKKQNE